MAQESQQSFIRLNKFIAQHLYVGRRQADTLIEQGRVTVNNVTAELGAHIDPGTDHVTVNGTILNPENDRKFTYLLFHKPVGYICSRRQQGETPTIYSLIPQPFQHLKPVGRLDKDSSGLLLLTNDGDFAHRMTHPSFHKQKQYEVSLDKPLEPLHRQLINNHGVALQDGFSSLHLTPLGRDSQHWLVIMYEGRNRQIRRTFAALGYAVTKLHRIAFGDYQLEKLEPGSVQEVHTSKHTLT